MKTIEVTEKEVQAAFEAAKSDEAKEILAALFCKKERPNLDDYRSIKTYEDACEALEESPILSENREKALCAKFPDHYDFRDDMPDHIIALMKLETISRALWGRNWQPKPDAEGNSDMWFPWFALWTEKELESLNSDQKRGLLSAHANIGAYAGFGSLHTYYRSSLAYAYSGFPLVPRNGRKGNILWNAIRGNLG